jgi:hypothetical protein
VDPAWVAALAALSGVVLGLVGYAVRGTWRAFRRGDQFLEDWNGIRADGGHEGRAGVMERLSRLEHNMADVQSQVHLNSGHSMRDEVQRIEAAVDLLDVKVEKMAITQANIQQTVDVLKARP